VVLLIELIEDEDEVFVKLLACVGVFTLFEDNVVLLIELIEDEEEFFDTLGLEYVEE